MKNFTIKSLLAALVTLVTLSFTSCGTEADEIPSQPLIALIEVGHDNSHEAHPGHDLHLEADVIAEGYVQSIHVVIRLEGGSTDLVSKTYTDSKYVDVLNAEFHEHIDIPATAAVGDYVLYFTVTDKIGQQKTVTADLEINLADDDHDDDHD